MALSDYFVWETRRRAPKEALVAEFPDTLAVYGMNFIAGRRFIVELPELELHVRPADDGDLTDDLAVFEYRCLAHSDKLARVLRKAGIDNIDYYPLRIVRDATGDIYRTHKAANILDVTFCVDRDKSMLTVGDEDPNELWFIDRLALIEERLGDTLCFRLGERPSTVIVHRRVKEAVEEAGISGPVFLPVEGYREYRGFGDDNPNNVMGTHDRDPGGPPNAILDEDADDGEDEPEPESGPTEDR
jgi:hypothetical protein